MVSISSSHFSVVQFKVGGGVNKQGQSPNIHTYIYDAALYIVRLSVFDGADLGVIPPYVFPFGWHPPFEGDNSPLLEGGQHVDRGGRFYPRFLGGAPITEHPVVCVECTHSSVCPVPLCPVRQTGRLVERNVIWRLDNYSCRHASYRNWDTNNSIPHNII